MHKRDNYSNTKIGQDFEYPKVQFMIIKKIRYMAGTHCQVYSC